MIQYVVAAQKPPHLKCIVPYDGGSAGGIYTGGVFRGSFASMWLADTVRQCLWPGPVEGKLPPPNLLVGMAAAPPAAGYAGQDEIEVPILSLAVQGGRLHTISQLDLYSKIKAPKKLLVLPGVDPGNAFFIESPALNAYILKWYDYWLKGIDTGIMDEPPVTIFDSGTKDWRYENEYPLARTKWTEFYLCSNPAGPATELPYGLIRRELPGNEKPDKYLLPESILQAFLGKPVLAYATPPLDKDVRVWGPLSIVLYGATTTVDTIWFVKVGDVGPDGKVNILTWGHLKASFREVDEPRSSPGQPFHPFRNRVLPEPKKVYEYQIELTPIFHTFKAGHRVWVQIASVDFEYQTFLHTVDTAEMLPVPGENTVYHDSAHPSHLLLPVIPDAPIIRSVGPPITDIKWPL